MQEHLLALLLANWSGLQVCLTIKGKIEDIQYLLFGLKGDIKAPAGQTRKVILGSHLMGYNVALFLVLLMTGCVLIAIAVHIDLGKTAPFYVITGVIYLIAAAVTGIYQYFDYRNIINILNSGQD